MKGMEMGLGWTWTWAWQKFKGCSSFMKNISWLVWVFDSRCSIFQNRTKVFFKIVVKFFCLYRARTGCSLLLSQFRAVVWVIGVISDWNVMMDLKTYVRVFLICVSLTFPYSYCKVVGPATEKVVTHLKIFLRVIQNFWQGRNACDKKKVQGLLEALSVCGHMERDIMKKKNWKKSLNFKESRVSWTRCGNKYWCFVK